MESPRSPPRQWTEVSVALKSDPVDVHVKTAPQPSWPGACSLAKAVTLRPRQ